MMENKKRRPKVKIEKKQYTLVYTAQPSKQ